MARLQEQLLKYPYNFKKESVMPASRNARREITVRTIQARVPIPQAVALLEQNGWTVQQTNGTFWGFIDPNGCRLEKQQCNLTSAFEKLVSDLAREAE